MNNELKERVRDFISMFDLVFDLDWDSTKHNIVDENFIEESGTFLNPFPGEHYGEHYTGGKGDNWANRLSLLAAYRELKAFAIREGIYNPDVEF